MTEPNGGERTVEDFRTLAAARVERTSLRGVAREIGISSTGLKKFLLGTAPYSPTLRRLRRWYVQQAAHLAPDETAGAASAAAVAVLVDDIAPPLRARAAHAVLAAVGAAFDHAGAQRPRWISEVRDHYPTG